MFEQGDIVKVIDVESIKKDELMDNEALEIMQKSNFTGDVTKVEGHIYFVGFSNELGWVTKGFKSDEIERVN